jgi:hypothetical protein
MEDTGLRFLAFYTVNICFFCGYRSSLRDDDDDDDDDSNNQMYMG